MKLKTHSGAKKRLRKLASGKIKRKQARRRHLLSNKSSKRKRHLGKTRYVESADFNRVNELLPYGS